MNKVNKNRVKVTALLSVKLKQKNGGNPEIIGFRCKGHGGLSFDIVMEGL
jgi:hypothetical protein